MVFHPAVTEWFRETLGTPTPAQTEAWSAIQSGRHALIAAPTGSGKTLAAFLSAINHLVERSLAGELLDETYVVYVSPLKALSNDIDKNLQMPLQGVAERLASQGHLATPIRTAVRTGDTLQKERAAVLRKPPHILVTTPESLFILLTSESGRRVLKTTRVVIVDEIHALIRDKRGSHLALSLERLERLVGTRLTRIGLSATQRPIETVARFLVGARNVKDDGRVDCVIVDHGHVRKLDIAIEIPNSPLETVMSGEVWMEVYDRLAALIREHRTTLVFVNTRRESERVARALTERFSAEEITSHHGSLSRHQRLDAEQRLKAGKLRALVATASLELGIDIGDVDLACQLGSTRAISTFLQRVGRSGHHHGGIPKGRLFPLSRDDLVECAALIESVRRRELDTVVMPNKPLDILAQQIVAEVAASEEWPESAMFELMKGAWPYRMLPRSEYEAIIKMLSEGFRTSQGRRGTYIHYDGVHRTLRPRRGARLSAITSGGAIPDTADYEVLLEPTNTRIGTLNEDFAIESMAGDIFQLGNASYRILRVEPGAVRVEDAKGQPPTIPFWLGEAPSRTAELSFAVARLRSEVAKRSEANSSLHYLVEEAGLSEAAARPIADYLEAAYKALGAMPTQQTLVMERFFDETGNMHLVVHAPFGSRLTRAWGLALRKRFCRSFNFELQAAATENALILSLGPTHSFPVQDVFSFLRSTSVRELLVQALLDSPTFEARWRWNAGRALTLLRFRNGKKVPPRIQRMQAQDLLAVVFPDQLACNENLVGDREIPDHPLVAQTIHDCLTEATDIEGLVHLLEEIEAGRITCIARDVTEPSPLAQEILNAKPYAFLDDAPLEERRTQAVMSRRWLDPQSASDIGALDPEAILQVCEDAWPDVTTPDELHDALLIHCAFTENEGQQSGWQLLFDALHRSGRAHVLETAHARLWVATEKVALWSAVHSVSSMDLSSAAQGNMPSESFTSENARVAIVRGRLEVLGPKTAQDIAEPLDFSKDDVDAALFALESDGSIFRGQFRQGVHETEWCERRLLARIHRQTVQRLRKEIEPVSAQDFMRFLFHWQHVDSQDQVNGAEGIVSVIAQLSRVEIPAAAWEADILPARVNEYDPLWLDQLCLAGRVAWARRGSSEPKDGRVSGPLRSTPVMLLPREHLSTFTAETHVNADDPTLSDHARRVLDVLERQGASFFEDIVRHTKLLRTLVEDALGELVTRGAVTSDGFSGLRALITPASRKTLERRRSGTSPFGMQSAGRWSVLHASRDKEQFLESIAWTLLRRWGVVFRRVLEREENLPPWREILYVYRRLEARGEIRGGRFVSGVTGEQYALPEAVQSLRQIRRTPMRKRLVSVSGADPLNLVGILTPGAKLTAVAGNRVLYCDGVPIALREAGKTQILESSWDGTPWQLEDALTRRNVPPMVRAYLGSRA